MQVTSKIFNGFVRNILKYFFFGVNILTLLLLFSSYMSWTVSPVKFIYLAYTGLAFAFILAANVFFIVFWVVFRRWKLSLINILSLLLCYAPINAFLPLNVSGKGTMPEDKIKVLSYNVRGFNWKTDEEWQKNPIFTYLKATDADIVCMQEYMASTNDRFASSKKLQKALEVYPYYSVTPLRSTRGGYEYGLACFSKYPILSTTQIPIDTSDNGSVAYKINVKGKIITVVNNHLESNRLTLKDKKLYKKFFKERNSEALDEVAHNIDERLGKAYKLRAPQADMVAQFVAEQKTDAVIVCGDFNDTPISYTYHTIMKNMEDSYVETGFGPGITYHENYFWFRIDFILHSKNMKAYDFKIDKVKYSDHYPIWSYLAFN